VLQASQLYVCRTDQSSSSSAGPISAKHFRRKSTGASGSTPMHGLDSMDLKVVAKFELSLFESCRLMKSDSRNLPVTIVLHPDLDQPGHHYHLSLRQLPKITDSSAIDEFFELLSQCISNIRYVFLTMIRKMLMY
jgi:hypothetical protein